MRSGMKKNCYQASHQCIKINSKRKEYRILDVKINKFEAYGDLLNQAFSHYNENLINNQELQKQIKNDETPGAEYSN